MNQLPPQRALEIAERHAASLPWEDNHCAVVAELIGRVEDGWLFRYALYKNPESQYRGEISLAEDTGFLVVDNGQALELTTARYAYLRQNVSEDKDAC